MSRKPPYPVLVSSAETRTTIEVYEMPRAGDMIGLDNKDYVVQLVRWLNQTGRHIDPIAILHVAMPQPPAQAVDIPQDHKPPRAKARAKKQVD